MTLAHVFVLLATGVAVGFAGGLLGLGGAFIMTPVQFMVYTSMGLPADTAIKLAFGTNLLVVLPTAASGAWRHWRKGAVYWRAALVMGACGFAFSLGGAFLATNLPGEVLKTVYGALVLASAVRMLMERRAPEGREPVDNPWVWLAWAAPVGVIGGTFGIGGAIVLVPVMVVALRFRIHTAIATTLVVQVFTSTGGLVGFIVNGLGVPGLPPYSVGYVNLASWLVLAVGSVGVAQFGAILAHKMSGRWLRYIFIAIMFYMGLEMVGVFGWLGWPL